MSYEPNYKKNKLKIQCPFRFFLIVHPEIPEGTQCINIECALWLPIQKACAIQVLARGYDSKNKRF